jgi:molybdopterin-guanine dinucleotide biosynthesis protein A
LQSLLALGSHRQRRVTIATLPVRGYILVGGKSSRFGSDKALLDVDGEPLALRIAAQMRPAVESVTLVGNPVKYGKLGLPVISDAVADFGPLGGLLAALEDSADEWNLVTACDMPLVTTDLFRFLVEQTATCSDDGVLPYDREGQPEPLCAAYRSSAAAKVRRAVENGVHKVMRALDGLNISALAPADYAAVDPEGTVFTNLNRVQDLERAGIGGAG